jgi:alkanesulfonate monooxygenase SsuD/methylene tetrahydromethanopterin reductase-like flavin-dependent oxidoreductase (luciferase family)
MWTEERVNFKGKFYSIENAFSEPKPIQKPRPPIMIGGSGERETLMLVAKFADACNVFGSPRTVKRKLEILRSHCRTVGRDYDAILKTGLGVTLIDDNADRLKQLLAERFKDVPENMRNEFTVYGQPDEIRNQIEEYRDAGIDYFITSFESKREVESIELFGNSVIKRF